jgi:GNAT superfamily N-acetyltransferase
MAAGEEPAVAALHDRSFRALAAGTYGPEVLAAHAGLVLDPAYAAGLAANDIWVAEAPGGALLGTAGWMAQPEPGLGRIRKVYVAPEAARQGIGRALMAAAEARAAVAGAHSLILRGHLNAVAFYQALGYAPDREDRMPLSGGLSMPVLFMRKALTAGA